MAGGLALGAVAFSAMDESWIHTAPEFGMAEAFGNHIESACAKKITPELLILGDSRAVAGISVQEIRAVGIDAEKFALGGSGIFGGWATLDRLIDCGVKPKSVVMAYGTVHMLESGALMERMTNFDVLKGPRASHAYEKASEWEERRSRKLAFKAVSLLGTHASLLDFVLMRPALRNVLERPPLLFENHALNERERKDFAENLGDRYYGLLEGNLTLPDEAMFPGSGPAAINWSAAHAIGDMGKANGFNVSFYILPLSELAKRDLPPRIFEMAEKFRSGLREFGVTAINEIWSLPDNDFGDPSHVNPKGRAKVMADFLKRLPLAGEATAETRPGVAGPDDPVALATKKLDQAGRERR